MTWREMLDAAAARVEPIADVVLHEGQVLFPYRPSALKNHYRWQWGVLAPPAWVAANASDRSRLQVECIADVRAGASLAARLRFVQLHTRTLGEANAGQAPGPAGATSGITPWDEAVVQSVDVGPVIVPSSGRPARIHARLEADACSSVTERLLEAGARPVTVRREARRITGDATLEVERVDGPWPLARVRLTAENLTPWVDVGASRSEVLRSSLVAAHAVLAIGGGTFLSATDPPEFAREAIATCRSEGWWPALAGPLPGGDAMFASPIILPDRPSVAAPSPGESCDATEIDELLSLAVAALGDDERREARLSDPVAAAVIDRFTAAARQPAALHGTARDMPVARLGDRVVRQGVRLRIRPAPGGDAQDLFVAGRVGIVESVLVDADGTTHVAVVIEDDPGADLDRLRGRYRYFRLHELVPLDDGA